MAWISENDADLLEMIKSGEGATLHVYLDSKGHPTIGYGHLIFRRDWTASQQQAALDRFIAYCRSHNHTFQHKEAKRRATWDEVREEIKGLAGIAQAKLKEWEANRDKEGNESAQAFSKYMKHTAANSCVPGTYATRSSAAANALVTKFLEQEVRKEHAEFVAAQKKFKQGYQNMGAGWWSVKTKLVFENGTSPLLILHDDVSELGIKPLKNGGPFSRNLENYPKKIQMVIIDIVYNMGYSKWTKLPAWGRLRTAIEASNWSDAEKELKSFPLDIPAERREHRAQLMREGGKELEEERAAAVKQSLEKAERANRRLHRGKLTPLE